MVDAVDAGTERCIVVWSRAREVRRSLRPVVWVVLEDVVLDAIWRNGRLVASTSARLVAEHLGLDPGTAASALRALRERGFVELEQHAGPGGRFGLAVYTVHLPVGVEVIASPCGERPHTAPPRTVNADTATKAVPRKQDRRVRPASKPVEQGTLDLGLGTR